MGQILDPRLIVGGNLPQTVVTPAGQLAQSSVPVILAPNGTIATNGIVTLGTALPFVYSGGAWVRFPANAVVGGAAGLYWVVFTSTTQGQVYTNFVDPAAVEFVPRVPSGTPVAAVGSNAAYTQTTGADVALVNAPIPGGAMGQNGALASTMLWNVNSNANSKIARAKFGGSVAMQASLTNHLGLTIPMRALFSNRGALNRQVINTTTTAGPSATVACAELAIDSSVNQPFLVTGQIATATDYLVLEQFQLQLSYGG